MNTEFSSWFQFLSFINVNEGKRDFGFLLFCFRRDEKRISFFMNDVISLKAWGGKDYLLVAILTFFWSVNSDKVADPKFDFYSVNCSKAVQKHVSTLESELSGVDLGSMAATLFNLRQ